MSDWLRNWQGIQQNLTNNSLEILGVIGISLLIFIVFWIFRRIFTTYIFKLFLRLTKKTKLGYDESILLAFEKPMRTFFIFIGLLVSINYAVAELPISPVVAAALTSGTLTLFRASIVFLIAWGLFNLSSESSAWLTKIGNRFNYELDQILLPFISKAIRFIIIALAFAIIADVLGYDVNGFVAGLGLGGLAFALAAQDSVKNIFGGIVIITEKPFTIGDWIQTPTVEGTVEDLTFRSTRIRTFADGLVTVPNSTLSNEAITNWSKMGRRQISFQLRIPFTTPRDRVDTVVKDIRQYLQNHDAINKQTLFVHFDKFTENSLEIMLYFFTNTTNWGEWLVIKEEVHFKILEVLEREEVSLATPARTIILDTDEDEAEELEEKLEQLQNKDEQEKGKKETQRENEQDTNTEKGKRS
ncbi:mechanosensitive ion channel family protein [Bacillus horti]|uniref:MscS family membrane protein n=1 Tax=Caldalkalibacillus horti TaxID=77523 RepID=A0ABT9W4J5_9BACI|nr:mechanosensitive ion channel family protein [Bacillus horti]MDQ0168171.1 MscS family membrane protein [Bacillus horti]